MNIISHYRDSYLELKRTIRLAFPLIFAQLIYGINGMIATIFLARFGKMVLATNVLVWGAFITLVLFFIGILNAVSILISQSHGAKDPAGIRLSFQQGWLQAFIFSVPMMLGMWYVPVLLQMTGQEPIVIQLAIPYCHSLAYCMLPLNLFVIMEQYLIGVSRTRLVMVMSMIEVPLELLFFYILVFGKLGFPVMGLSGIGYGLTLAMSAVSFFMGIIVWCSSEARQYHLFSRLWFFNAKYFWELIRVGTPLGGMYCVEVALFAVMGLMMGHFGTDALAAHQIAVQCFTLALTIIFGLSQGTTVRVGYEVGRRDRLALKRAVYVSMGLGLFFMFLVGLVYVFYPQIIIGLYVNTHAAQAQGTVRYAIYFLWLVGIVQLTDSFRTIEIAALRGIKDTKMAFFISVVTFWVIAFPAGYLFAFVFHWGAKGIWIGIVVGLVCTAAWLFVRFQRLIDRIDLENLITRAPEKVALNQ